MKERRNSGYGFVALAAILWGTTGTAQAFAPSGAGPLSIGAIRMILGGVIMVMIPLVKQRFHIGNIPRKKFILLASVCIAAYQPLFFTGVQRSGVAIGTLIAIGSAPVFSGMIDKMTGNQLSLQWKVSTMISLLGCLLLIGVDPTIQLDVMGVICSLLAGMVYALYVKAAQKVLVLGPNQLANGLMFLVSGMILLPFLLMSDLTWVWSIRGSMVVLHLGVFSAALAFTLFARGLQSVDAPTAVTLTLVEPLTATLLGLFVLHEQITMIQGFGLIVLFFGLAVNTKLVFQFLFPKYEEAS